MKFVPNVGRVLVLPAQAEEKTAGGIIIPDTAKEKPQKGTIAAIGPQENDSTLVGTNGKALNFQEGDVVYYGKYSGTEIELEEGVFLIMKATDILGAIPTSKEKQK